MAHQNLRWTDQAHTTVGTLRRVLSKNGWRVTAPWKFTQSLNQGSVQEQSLDLSEPSQLLKDLHALRTQWRHEQVDKWIEADRHEATEALEKFTEEQIHQQFDQVDLKRTRNQCDISRYHRNILLSSFVSQAWLHVSQEDTSPICPICNEDHGTFHHTMYVCTELDTPPCEIPEDPPNFWSYRFGWIRKGHVQQDAAHLDCMVAKAMQVQKHRKQT